MPSIGLCSSPSILLLQSGGKYLQSMEVAKLEWTVRGNKSSAAPSYFLCRGNRVEFCASNAGRCHRFCWRNGSAHGTESIMLTFWPAGRPAYRWTNTIKLAQHESMNFADFPPSTRFLCRAGPHYRTETRATRRIYE